MSIVVAKTRQSILWRADAEMFNLVHCLCFLLAGCERPKWPRWSRWHSVAPLSFTGYTVHEAYEADESYSAKKLDGLLLLRLPHCHN